MFRVGNMKPKDFPFAVELANMSGWDMADVDFEYMSTLEPDGCFVLWQGRERVGIATCINYGKLGWFGNLAVKSEFRRKGAGRFLVEHAIEYLEKQGVKSVGLYAYQHLLGFYERIGFKPLDDFIVLNGTLQAKIAKGKEPANANENDIAKLAKFDTDCLRWERERLLQSMLREEGNLCYVSSINGDTQGFVMAKVYGEVAEIGPLISKRDREPVALKLAGAVLTKLNGLEVYAYLPACEKLLLDVFLAAGLKEKFRVTRMFLGSATAQSCVYMPESLERG